MNFTKNLLKCFEKLKSHLLENGYELQEVIAKAIAANPWFTQEHIKYQLQAIIEIYLNINELTKFLENYQLTTSPKKVGIIAAGNIPLVCFHDVICVLASGNQALLKCSSQDTILPTYLAHYINSQLNDEVIILVDSLKDFDAVIATGSNHSAKTFKQYFADKPNIIRQSRTSLAILNKQTSDEDLRALCDDVFLHFGLGCRNVTYFLVEDKVVLVKWLAIAEKHYQSHFSHTKYMNNYEYRKTIMILNIEDYFATDFVLCQASEQLFSPISCINYKITNDERDIKQYIYKHQHDLQCVVGLSAEKKVEYQSNFIEISFVDFGETQRPTLFDFADGVDTMKFLEKI